MKVEEGRLMAYPPQTEPCIAVCFWDPYHRESRVWRGIEVCNDCSRPMCCIQHDDHGVILADGIGIRGSGPSCPEAESQRGPTQ